MELSSLKLVDKTDEKSRFRKCCTTFSWRSFFTYVLIGVLIGTIVLVTVLTVWLTTNRITTTVTTTTSTSATSTTSTSTSTTETTATTTTTTTTTTTSICTSPGWAVSPPGGWGGASIIYTFDQNTNDYFGLYNAVPVGSLTYISPGSDGRGSAIRIDPSHGQYLTVAKHMNFYQKNLTVEAWVYPLQINLTTDSIIYAQTNASILGQYMWMMLRAGKIYGAFFSSDVSGSTLFKVNQWQHMAFTYNYPNKTQIVYVDGVQDGANYNATPCLITAGVQTIGALTNITSSFNGYIDHLLILFDTAKSSYDILTDATLVAQFSMDCAGFTALDSGPNQMPGVAVDLSMDGGWVNQAYLFNRTTAYFQTKNLLLLGQGYRPYSFAMWLRPMSSPTTGGIILHVSSFTNGSGWCMPFLGFDSTGQLIANGWDGSIVRVSGPMLTVNEWVHVALTYSATNGLRLYINRQLVAGSYPYVYVASGVPMTVTLGQSLNVTSCANGVIVPGNYRGHIDELYIFSRELSQWDIPM